MQALLPAERIIPIMCHINFKRDKSIATDSDTLRHTALASAERALTDDRNSERREIGRPAGSEVQHPRIRKPKRRTAPFRKMIPAVRRSPCENEN